MKYEYLMNIVVEIILIFELSDKNIVDEDTAMSIMEQVASSLQQLNMEENVAFLDYVHRQSENVERYTSLERKCIRGIPENFGLVE